MSSGRGRVCWHSWATRTWKTRVGELRAQAEHGGPEGWARPAPVPLGFSLPSLAPRAASPDCLRKSTGVDPKAEARVADMASGEAA